jgi:hypothetical protein
MYIMCGMLFIGFLCNAAIRAVEERHHYREAMQGSQTG